MTARVQELDVKLLLFAIQRTTTFESLLAQRFVQHGYEVTKFTTIDTVEQFYYWFNALYLIHFSFVIATFLLPCHKYVISSFLSVNLPSFLIYKRQEKMYEEFVHRMQVAGCRLFFAC